MSIWHRLTARQAKPSSESATASGETGLTRAERRASKKQARRQAEANRKGRIAVDYARQTLAEYPELLAKSKQGLAEIERERALRQAERDRLRRESDRENRARLDELEQEIQALDNAETYVRQRLAEFSRDIPHLAEAERIARAQL